MINYYNLKDFKLNYLVIFLLQNTNTGSKSFTLIVKRNNILPIFAYNENKWKDIISNTMET